MNKLTFVFFAVVSSAFAMPQLDIALAVVDEEPIARPEYSYEFQVADDEAQTYIAKNENRDGDHVNGQYSYVDPLGSLVVVRYTAGPEGYTEQREIQHDFVQIRSKPVVASNTFTTVSSSSNNNNAFVDRVVSQVTPVVDEVVTTETTSSTSTSANDDADLVARIIAQLTPFIRQSVTSSLATATVAEEPAQQVVTTTTSRRPVATRVVTRRRPRPRPVVRPIAVSTQQASSSSVRNIFGEGGANNIRFSAPDVNYNVEF